MRGRARTRLPAILGEAQPPRSVDLLSIDVDGVDYWLWRDFLESGRAAKVVVIEFNPRCRRPVRCPYGPTRSAPRRVVSCFMCAGRSL